MASPFIPHITEEMFHAQVIKREDSGIKEAVKSKSDSGYFSTIEGVKSIHNTRWPLATVEYSNSKNNENSNFALFVISEIRKYKSDNKMRLGTPVSLLKIKCSAEQKDNLSSFLSDIASLAKANNIEMELLHNGEVIIEIQV